MAQQALLKQLYNEYDKGTTSDEPLHTNTPQVQSSKGYKSESELFADMNSPAYKNDPKYNKMVQDKLARTNREDWSF